MKHIVGFSGGVDSQAAALWARRQFPPEDVILCNADPGGNEHPLTTEFIQHYSETVHPVITIKPQVSDMLNRAPGAIEEMGLQPTDPLTFDLLAKLKGRFPGTKLRFCTTHLKLEPMRRWCWENGAKGLNEPRRKRDGSWYRPYGEEGCDANGDRPGILAEGMERYAGVRRDESQARANVLDREFDDYFLCWLNRPLASWTKHEVFAYIAEAGEEINPLYRMGFGRVGCAPCINSNKDDIRLWAARFPEMIDKIRSWEESTGRSFFPPILPGGRYGFIDEVVKWAKTTHGGRQYALPIVEAEADAGLCSSQYGLCE